LVAWCCGGGLAGPACQDQPAHVLGDLRRVTSAFLCRDDRSLHQNVPGVRKPVGIIEPGSRRQLGDNRPDLGELQRRRPADRAVLLRLDQAVDERSALKIGLLEPAIEDIEDRQQLRDRVALPA
jgi:hypothetical protein